MSGLEQLARKSRRAQIEEFFRTRLRVEISSAVLHDRFGSAFRTRVSEINRDPRSTIRIFNRATASRGDDGQPCEGSIYWAELRDTAAGPGSESDFMRRRREERASATPLFSSTEAGQ